MESLVKTPRKQPYLMLRSEIRQLLLTNQYVTRHPCLGAGVLQEPEICR